jgi:hypothetical protein
MKALTFTLAAVVALGAAASARGGEVVYGPVDPPRRTLSQRIWECFDRCSCSYGKTHLDVGCTGPRADAVFVFGSCAEFFGEPCFKQTPPPHRYWKYGRHFWD